MSWFLPAGRQASELTMTFCSTIHQGIVTFFCLPHKRKKQILRHSSGQGKSHRRQRSSACRNTPPWWRSLSDQRCVGECRLGVETAPAISVAGVLFLFVISWPKMLFERDGTLTTCTIFCAVQRVHFWPLFGHFF